MKQNKKSSKPSDIPPVPTEQNTYINTTQTQKNDSYNNSIYNSNSRFQLLPEISTPIDTLAMRFYSDNLPKINTNNTLNQSSIDSGLHSNPIYSDDEPELPIMPPVTMMNAPVIHISKNLIPKIDTPKAQKATGGMEKVRPRKTTKPPQSKKTPILMPIVPKSADTVGVNKKIIYDSNNQVLRYNGSQEHISRDTTFPPLDDFLTKSSDKGRKYPNGKFDRDYTPLPPPPLGDEVVTSPPLPSYSAVTDFLPPPPPGEEYIPPLPDDFLEKSSNGASKTVSKSGSQLKVKRQSPPPLPWDMPQTKKPQTKQPQAQHAQQSNSTSQPQIQCSAKQSVKSEEALGLLPKNIIKNHNSEKSIVKSIGSTLKKVFSSKAKHEPFAVKHKGKVVELKYNYENFLINEIYNKYPNYFNSRKYPSFVSDNEIYEIIGAGLGKDFYGNKSLKKQAEKYIQKSIIPPNNKKINTNDLQLFLFRVKHKYDNKNLNKTELNTPLYLDFQEYKKELTGIWNHILKKYEEFGIRGNPVKLEIAPFIDSVSSGFESGYKPMNAKLYTEIIDAARKEAQSNFDVQESIRLSNMHKEDKNAKQISNDNKDFQEVIGSIDIDSTIKEDHTQDVINYQEMSLAEIREVLNKKKGNSLQT